MLSKSFRDIIKIANVIKNEKLKKLKKLIVMYKRIKLNRYRRLLKKILIIINFWIIDFWLL